MPSHIEKLIFNFGTYEGETDTETGLRHGIGVLRYSNGNTYEGQWESGAATGHGKKVWANGDVYEGGFLAGKKSGEGRYSFSNGAVFCGNYADDTPNGFGTQLMPNGDRYDGDWRNGRRHGEGTEILHDGQRFEGIFHQGKKNGKGTLVKGNERVTGIWEADRSVEVLSREAVPESDGARPLAAPHTDRASLPPMPMDAMLAEMSAAGLDGALLSQIAAFNTNVFGQMERVMHGLGSLDSHLQDLQDCLEEVEAIKHEEEE